MKNKKKILFLSLLCMIVGFAAVSTTLILNGKVGIGTNEPDFDVYFSKAIENGTENASIIKDNTHLEFTTELTGLDDSYVLDYEVTNASKQYDANLIMNCTGGNEHLRVENKFDVTEVLPARTTRKGKLTLTVIQAVIEEMSVSISCEISGNAIERDVAGGDAIEIELGDYLKISNRHLSTSYLGYTLDKSKVETIKLVDSNEMPEDAVLIGDVSDKQNGSIMMYSKDEDNNSKLELYIGQNDGVKLNPDSSYLFFGFEYLTTIEGLENIDTSYVEKMNGMFKDCYRLTNLNVSNFNTSNVATMGYMFSSCGDLTSLDVSNFITSKVTSMECMFDDCFDLKSLDLSHFDTSNVTNMRMMFGGEIIDMKISEIIGVSNFIMDNVENIGGMFQNCANLSSLDLSKWNTSNVTDMENMFNNCTKLTDLNISGFNTSNVTDMHGMFNNCHELTTIDLSHFDTSRVTRMDFMFYYCYGLTTIDLSHFNTSNVTDMRRMFYYCYKLTTINLSNFDTSNVTDMSEMFMMWTSSALREIKGISDFDTRKVTKMDSMFERCSNLNATISIIGTKCTSYTSMFSSAATKEGAQITVNYTEDASDLVDKMIATKSSNSNVVKGNNISRLITIQGNDEVSVNYAKGYKGQTITLLYKDGIKVVTSFKMNGTLVEGNTFTMPNENVVITDIVVGQIPSPNAEEIKNVTPDEIFNSNTYFSKFIIEKFGSMEKFEEYQQEVCKDGNDSETCQNAGNEFMNEMEEWMKYLHVFATYRYGSIENYKEWQSNACVDESSTTCENAMTQFFNDFKKWKNS